MRKFMFSAAMAGAFAGLGAGLVIGGLQQAVSGAFELASSMSEAAARIGVNRCARPRRRCPWRRRDQHESWRRWRRWRL